MNLIDLFGLYISTINSFFFPLQFKCISLLNKSTAEEHDVELLGNASWDTFKTQD